MTAAPAATLRNLELPLFAAPGVCRRSDLHAELKSFQEFGTKTRTCPLLVQDSNGSSLEVPVYVNEFWTAKQRQASSLHEVSYRACFKPQLPRFFIERLTAPGDIVYDPFMGRGTTPIEAALLGRIPFGNDANPLSRVMTRPRLSPPFLSKVELRLAQIDFQRPVETPKELLVFYHPDTLQQVCSLREYLLLQTRDHRRPERHKPGGKNTAAALNHSSLDTVDDWISLVALNRLTGHSAGFFSVYTLPPNQAVSVRSQEKINAKRGQVPPPRNVAAIITKKSKQLLGDVNDGVRGMLAGVAGKAVLLTGPAADTAAIPSNSVALVVTSPPFLNVVQYATDNWLRCWFLGLDAEGVRLTTPTRLDTWATEMTRVFHELHRVLRPGGHIAFEVGEVHSGATRLEETVLPCGIQAGLRPVLVLINDQKFTKTANCWGIDNMSKGTNTNRIVLFRKE